jgi:hypothetical protein
VSYRVSVLLLILIIIVEYNTTKIWHAVWRVSQYKIRGPIRTWHAYSRLVCTIGIVIKFKGTTINVSNHRRLATWTIFCGNPSIISTFIRWFRHTTWIRTEVMARFCTLIACKVRFRQLAMMAVCQSFFTSDQSVEAAVVDYSWWPGTERWQLALIGSCIIWQ